jgi:hypothetical protein
MWTGEALKSEWLRSLNDEIREVCSDSSQSQISQQETAQVLAIVAQ